MPENYSYGAAYVACPVIGYTWDLTWPAASGERLASK